MEKLTGGSAEEAAFSSLPKATRLRVWVATVSFLPPFEFGPCPRPKLPRFHHFRGRKYSRYPKCMCSSRWRCRFASDVTGFLTCLSQPWCCFVSRWRCPTQNINMSILMTTEQHFSFCLLLVLDSSLGNTGVLWHFLFTHYNSCSDSGLFWQCFHTVLACDPLKQTCFYLRPIIMGILWSWAVNFTITNHICPTSIVLF